MKFNRFIFDNYLQTNEGKESLEFFDKFSSFVIHNNVNEIFNFLKNQYLQEISNELVEDILGNVNYSIKYQLEEFSKENKNVNSIESAGKYFDFFIKLTIENMKDLTKRQILNYITDISLVLYILHSDYFFPYFFVDHFFKLEAIFSEFGIPMPIIPSKVKHEERLYYYFELCKSLFEFRNNNNLSPIELNIFLYAFSENVIENVDIRKEELPEPTKVYISGATKDDCTDIIENANSNTKQLWAGNVNTLPGDIVLIYGVSPFSQINSIWRAISKGFLDPFSYWFNLIWVGHMVKIPGISYQELLENEIWGNKSIVKSHMQGVSGVQCTIAEYDEIIKITKSKGFDTKILPEIKGPQLSILAELNIERDVEIHLLEPLLHKLGYTEKDWIRQMSLRMGRGERIYPDYAIKANTKRGEETAEFIWEAKFKISNRNQLLEDFFQAKSYALRLNTSGLGLVAMEGIWLSYKKDSFMFDKIKKYTWEEINNSDIFNKILLEIGNKK
jgi:hypothetical protein